MDAQQMAAAIRAAIDAGELRPGDRLPTMDELAAHYAVNRNTASKAISQLKTAGLLSGLKGGATRVRVIPPYVVRDNLDYHVEKARVLLPEEERAQYGTSEKTTGIPVKDLHKPVYEYNVIECPENVAKILEVPEGSKVLHRFYQRQHVEFAGVDQADSYIPYDIVKDFPELLDSKKEPWPGGTFHQMYFAGIEVGRVVDRFRTSMPTPEEVVKFDMPPSVPINHRTKITYDYENRPLEVAFIPMPADRYEFTFSTVLERWQ